MSTPSDEDFLQILRHNQGFSQPERWLTFAKAHNFQKIKAEKLHSCPDCSSQNHSLLGQFVYYSTLCKLCHCLNCDLVYVDTRLDPTVIKGHFEQTYKDEEYFVKQRQRIFNQIADIVKRRAPKNAAVLDVGGAKGHLAQRIKELRPDLSLTVNDLSEESCKYAASTYGLKTIAAPFTGLDVKAQQYQVLLLVDILYYEPNIAKFWQILRELVAPNGLLIMRLPNKLLYQRIAAAFVALLKSKKQKEMQSNFNLFNPEHIYIFSRKYLRSRLQQAGFKKVKFLPAELTGGTNPLVRTQTNKGQVLAMVLYLISFGTVITTPAQIVVAQKS